MNIYDTSSAILKKAMRVYSDINGLTFSANGSLLVASSPKGFATVYDATSGKRLLTLGSAWGSTDWVAVAPDGLFDGSRLGMASLLVWRFGSGLAPTAPVETFFNEFYAPGLLSEVFRGGRPVARKKIELLDRRQPVVRIDAGGVGHLSVRLDIAEAAVDQQHPTGSGVRDVRLFRNGSLVHVWRGELPLAADGTASLQASFV